MRVSKLKPFARNRIGVNSILLDPAISELFIFQHDVGASINFNNFFRNPDVDSFSVVSDAFPDLALSNPAFRLLHRVVSLRTNQFDLVSPTDPIW